MRKILCLTSIDLEGRVYGATLRTRHLFQHLAQLGTVELIFASDFATAIHGPSIGGYPLVDVFTFPKKRWTLRERLQNEFDPRFLNTEHRSASAESRARLEQHLAGYDLIWIHGLRIANRFGRWHWPRTVLDIDDIPSTLSTTSAAAATTIAQKLKHRRQAFLWRRRERLLPERFSAVCVCSESDRQLLGGGDRVYVIPNGYTIPACLPERAPVSPPRIGFVGNFGHAPNRNGIKWFIREVWPLLRQAQPDLRLRLAGGGVDGLDILPSERVDALDWVDDMAQEMATWSLTIVPIRFGGGTRVKLAEAFSRKCPVVSTSVGAYGYGVTDGRELRIADTAEAFSQACSEVLVDPIKAQEMSSRAWERFLAEWSWDAQFSRVAAAANQVLNA